MTALKNIKIQLPALYLPITSVYGSLSAQQKSEDQKGLKDYYKNYFPVGVAITPSQLEDPGQCVFILKHFNSVTAENAMKMGPIHPEESRYNWKEQMLS